MPRGVPFSQSVRRDIFDRVCRGESIRDAAAGVGVSYNTAWLWWRDAGAMRLHQGPGKRGLVEPGDLDRAGGRGHRISFDERIEIMRGLDTTLTYAKIGERIGRDGSVVWREVNRNRNPDGEYHAGMAHARATQNTKRPKEFKLNNPVLCAEIETWMDDGWSPRLIAKVLARDHPDDKLARVSHETIYQCLYVQTRGQLRADLNKCLST